MARQHPEEPTLVEVTIEEVKAMGKQGMDHPSTRPVLIGGGLGAVAGAILPVVTWPVGLFAGECQLRGGVFLEPRELLARHAQILAGKLVRFLRYVDLRVADRLEIRRLGRRGLLAHGGGTSRCGARSGQTRRRQPRSALRPSYGST